MVKMLSEFGRGPTSETYFNKSKMNKSGKIFNIQQLILNRRHS